ncbi:glycosyltransferase [Marinobacter sp. JSM 1782161]|uniref:glycosyltransferase n=1 Tax=Marinobacter sp. JSM 1782161 TaxID=2685906 RepID=UPI0014020A34|nr:glycosyltransferase [Marinobacter sp. JSM 1782161]
MEDYEYLNDKGLGDYFHQAEQTRDMAAALKGVDVVAMPSRWEACGLLAMEALAAGVPIIGSDCVGLREVLRDSPALVCRAGDAESLKNALVDQFRQAGEKKLQFSDYQAQAVEKFSVKRPAASFRRLYEDLA